MSTTFQEQRLHHFDAIRASALLAGIFLHAIMSYMPGFRESNWPLSDGSTSPSLGVVYFIIHLFRMSVFFVIAGLFGRALHQRLGTKGLIKNRLRRIGLPLISFYLVAMPLTVVAIIWGARQQGIKAAAQMMAFPVPVVGPPVPWGHLWFLYMLLVLYLLVLLVRSLVVRLDGNGSFRSAIGSLFIFLLKLRLAPVALALPISLSLYFSGWWVQWQGIPSPIVGLIPNLPSLLAYGGAFLIGWVVHRHQESLAVLAADWRIYALIATISTIVALSCIGITPRLRVIELDNVHRATFAGAYVLAQWSWTFAIIGFATHRLGAPSNLWRYLADASYWMYLIHLPLIMLLQAWMLQWPLHWSLKLALVLLISSGVLLTSYHFLVRSTFMGSFLNGRRYLRS